MPYQLADLNNGPFGEEFASLEEAAKEYEKCVAEGVARALSAVSEDEYPREEIERDARHFFRIITTDDNGNTLEELTIWPS